MKEKTLKNKIKRLHNAIRHHRDEKGTNRCWLDDQLLYSVLPEGKKAVTLLPERHLFIRNCERFYDTRQNPNETGGPHAWNDPETKAEAEVIKLKEENQKLKELYEDCRLRNLELATKFGTAAAEAFNLKEKQNQTKSMDSCPDHPLSPVVNYTTGRRCSSCLRLIY